MAPKILHNTVSQNLVAGHTLLISDKNSTFGHTVFIVLHYDLCNIYIYFLNMLLNGILLQFHLLVFNKLLTVFTVIVTVYNYGVWK